jgi:DNA-binding NarL/FixJ family response regulator
MLKAGAHGYLLKDADFDELLAAIRAVAAGRTYVGAGVNAGQALVQEQRE